MVASMRQLVTLGAVGMLAVSMCVPATAWSGDVASKIDRKVQRMTKCLSLNEEQQQQVRTILEDTHQQMKALRDSKHTRIREVLTPEQQGQFDQWKAGTVGRKHGRKGFSKSGALGRREARGNWSWGRSGMSGDGSWGKGGACPFSE